MSGTSPAQQAIERASAELPPVSLLHSQYIEQELAAAPELGYAVAWFRARRRLGQPTPAVRVRSERRAHYEEQRRRGWRGSKRS